MNFKCSGIVFPKSDIETVNKYCILRRAIIDPRGLVPTEFLTVVSANNCMIQKDAQWQIVVWDIILCHCPVLHYVKKGYYGAEISRNNTYRGKATLTVQT